jgi:hypothetical protein
MPAEVSVYAIEATDMETFGEDSSPPAAASDQAVGSVLAEVGE